MTQSIKTGALPSVKQRNSNLELFRILTMMSIVAHHYVVNSELLAADGVINSNPNVALWAIWTAGRAKI